MRSRAVSGLVLVAVLQVVALAIMPPQSIVGAGPILLVGLAILALVGFSLWQRRMWARTATIFIQGMNIVVRLLITLSGAVQGPRGGGPLDVWLIGTSLLSMLVSAFILHYIDQPDIQMLME